MTGLAPFKPLSVETLNQRLKDNAVLRNKLGADADNWKVREVGDGNLNLVFIVEGSKGTVIVKQALPYLRLAGDSWPLTLRRSFFEYHALTRQAARDPGLVPEVFFFDESQSIIAMEYLSPHIILRQALIRGQELPKVAKDLGTFMARTLFRGSDLSMDASKRKKDVALFAENDELCAISENLVFTDPYFEAKANRHTSPQLDGIVAELRADRDLKVEAQRLKQLFTSSAETLVHGDLHTGSVMVTPDDTKVIDPEFAFYGPIAFDVGMLLSNFWMSYFAQAGHEGTGSRDSMRRYLLNVTTETWTTFWLEFSNLWRTERTGILYPRSVFEDRGDVLGSEQALAHMMRRIWVDALGFAGVEIHRRILGLAHNADFETITDVNLRAACETQALKFGRHLVVNASRLLGSRDVNNFAARLATGEIA